MDLPASANTLSAYNWHQAWGFYLPLGWCAQTYSGDGPKWYRSPSDIRSSGRYQVSGKGRHKIVPYVCGV